MKVKLSTFSLSLFKLCPATVGFVRRLSTSLSMYIEWTFFLIFSSSFQKVQPKCASEKKDFRLSIKRKQSCQVKKKRRVFNAIKKTFYSKKPIVFAKHMIWCWKTFLRIYHNYIICKIYINNFHPCMNLPTVNLYKLFFVCLEVKTIGWRNQGRKTQLYNW